MTALEMRGVFKRYRAGIRGCSAGIDALRGIDLVVRRGEVVGIVGAPGAGKTTLLLCAAGLLRADAGTVSWFGTAAIRPHRPAGIAYVPPALGSCYGFLTVQEALEHHAVINQLEPAVRARRLDDAVRATQLASCIAVRIAELPLGESRRLALAHAMIASPRLWLIDDLCSDLDSAEQALLANIITDLGADGSGVLFAARAAGAAGQCATRLTTLSLGRIGPQSDTVLVPSLHRVAERAH